MPGEVGALARSQRDASSNEGVGIVSRRKECLDSLGLVDERLAKLKVPARDLLPNRQALQRAHALFERLAPARRDQLTRVLGPFEAALAHDDRVAADQTRPALLAMLRSLEA